MWKDFKSQKNKQQIQNSSIIRPWELLHAYAQVIYVSTSAVDWTSCSSLLSTDWRDAGRGILASGILDHHWQSW